MTKPGDYVICVDAVHGLKSGHAYRVHFVDCYGGFYIGGITGPLNPERFKPAPSYEQLLQQRDKLLAALTKASSLLAEIVELNDNWKPIETAPKDGKTFVAMCNEVNGLVDIAYWSLGEWSSVYGNGDMTHWRHLTEGEYEVGPYGYPVWKRDLIKN